MRTTKLIIGIFSIVLSIFITLQSLVAGLGNTFMNNDEVSGTAGIFVSVFMLVAGIVVLATLKRRTMAPTVIYTISGLIGLMLAGSYTDLYIWSSLNLIFAIILFFVNRQTNTNKKSFINDDNDNYEEYDSRTESRSTRKHTNQKNNSWVYIVIAILIVGFSDLFFDFSGLGILEDIRGNNDQTEVASSNIDTDEQSDDEVSNVIETDDFKIEIRDVWLETNEFTDDEIIVFEYDITNKREEPTGNDTDWLLTMSAVQDNSEDVINTLDYSTPKDYGIEAYTQVKPGGTTTYGQGYVLSDMETPVTLTAQEFLGGTLWEKEFDITNLIDSNSIETSDAEDKKEENVATNSNARRSTGKFMNLPKLAKAASETLASNSTTNESDNISSDSNTNYTSSSGYTDADIAYWNSIANQYGFQSYGGQSDFASYVQYAQEAVRNAEVYGTPYPEEEYYSQSYDDGLQGYYEDENGVLYENPVYENRYGPDDYTQPDIPVEENPY